MSQWNPIIHKDIYILTEWTPDPPTNAVPPLIYYVLSRKRECADCSMNGTTTMPEYWNQPGYKKVYHTLFDEGKSKIIITWLIASLLPFALAGQDISAVHPPAGEKLENYCRSNPFEEVWLHTDREIYASGEAVRIKGYLLSYPELKLASYDSYVYAEILAHDNRPVAQATMMVEEGSGTVMLYLPDTLSSGTYLLRAYTAVMKNYMPHGCFMKSITVVNPLSDRQVNLFTGTKLTNDPPSEVIFLPEGGALINGTENRTGIITLNRYGFPVSCSGRLESEDGLTVTEVTSDSTGTGLFSFTPEKGVKYYFIPENDSERYLLPACFRQRNHALG